MLSPTEFIEVAAVITGTVYGVLLAKRKEMDFVGVFCVAFMTSFGGGTLRDVLLDRHPLFWIRNPHYPVVVFVVALLTSIVPRIPKWIERSLNFPDALGLGLFSVAGTQTALQCGTSPFLAVLFGVMTGTFGGVIGDIACNEIPGLFRPHTPLYATCAFVGGWVLLASSWFGIPPDASAGISVGLIVIVRIAALHWNLCLPRM